MMTTEAFVRAHVAEADAAKGASCVGAQGTLGSTVLEFFLHTGPMPLKGGGSSVTPCA